MYMYVYILGRDWKGNVYSESGTSVGVRRCGQEECVSHTGSWQYIWRDKVHVFVFVHAVINILISIFQ